MNSLSKEFNKKWLEKQKEREELYLQRENQLQQQQKDKEDQYRKRELQLQQQQQDFSKKLEDEKRLMEATLRQEMQAKVGADYEHKLRLLEDDNKTKESKLNEAREKELDFMRKMQELKNKEQELELEMQRKMLAERERIEEDVKKNVEEKNKVNITEFEMKLKERDKQLEDQKRMIEEMKRKS